MRLCSKCFYVHAWQSLQDRCTPIDMREVLEGTIKTVGVLYDRPSSTVAASSGTKVSPFAALVNSVRRTCQGGLGEEGFGASRHLGSEHLRPPSASAGALKCLIEINI